MKNKRKRIKEIHDSFQKIFKKLWDVPMKDEIRQYIKDTENYEIKWAGLETHEERQAHILNGESFSGLLRMNLEMNTFTKQEKLGMRAMLNYMMDGLQEKKEEDRELSIAKEKTGAQKTEIEPLNKGAGRGFTGAKSKGKWETISEGETENKKAIGEAIIKQMKDKEIKKGLEQTEEQFKENNKLAESLKLKQVTLGAGIDEEKEAMYTAWLEKQAQARRDELPGVKRTEYEDIPLKIGANTNLEKNSEPKQEIDLNIVKWMHNKTYEVKDGEKVIGSYKKDGDKLSYNSSGNEKTDQLVTKAMVEHLLKISSPPITATGDEKLVNMVKDVCDNHKPKIDFINGNENKASHRIK